MPLLMLPYDAADLFRYFCFISLMRHMMPQAAVYALRSCRQLSLPPRRYTMSMLAATLFSAACAFDDTDVFAAIFIS